MERFTVKIDRVYKSTDNKMMIVFDIITNGVKVGEAESEHAVFQGILIGKLTEYMTTAHIDLQAAALQAVS